MFNLKCFYSELCLFGRMRKCVLNWKIINKDILYLENIRYDKTDEKTKRNIPALSQYELFKYIKSLNIIPFGGHFMRNTLPTLSKPWKIEYGILELDSNEGEGTHWTFWSEKYMMNFHSYGLISPEEFDNYNAIPIWYSPYNIRLRYLDIIMWTFMFNSSTWHHSEKNDIGKGLRNNFFLIKMLIYLKNLYQIKIDEQSRKVVLGLVLIVLMVMEIMILKNHYQMLKNL